MRDISMSPGAIVESWRLRVRRLAAFLLIVLMGRGSSSVYSVLTHQKSVGLLWTDQILPLLQHRYPGLSEDQIREAHAYAYGGAGLQDLGYYPFGSRGV